MFGKALIFIWAIASRLSPTTTKIGVFLLKKEKKKKKNTRNHTAPVHKCLYKGSVSVNSNKSPFPLWILPHHPLNVEQVVKLFMRYYKQLINITSAMKSILIKKRKKRLLVIKSSLPEQRPQGHP